MLTPAQINGEEKAEIVAVFYAKHIEKQNGFMMAQYRAVEKFELHPDLISAEDDAKLVFTAVGNNLPQESGKKKLLVGYWITSAETGRVSFRVEYARRAPLASREDIQDYFRSIESGMSEETIGRIIEAFGLASPSTLRESPEEVVALFKGAWRSSIYKMRSSIEEDEVLDDISEVLALAELPAEYAHPVFEALGRQAVVKIKDNPYILSRVLKSDFHTVDKAALCLGMAPTHPKRVAAAFHFSFDSLQNNEGHVCINPDYLKMMATRLLNRGITSEVSSVCVQGIIDRELSQKALVLYGGMLYRAHDYLVERNLAMLVAEMLKWPADDELADKVERAIQRWQKRNPKVRLAQKQVEAILLLRHAIAMITGGPGTGKTTTLRAIIEIYHEILPDSGITLLASTGRAAGRMREAMGPLAQHASTIHKGLEIIPYDEMLTGQKMLTPGLVITDEYSMVSEVLAHTQLSAIDLKKEYCFLIVGDENQLSSIQPGDVMRQLLSTGIVPNVKLDIVFRQDEKSLIPRNCRNIVDKVHQMEFDENSFVFHPIDARPRDEVTRQVLDKVMQLYHDGTALYGENETVVLSPFRRHGLLATAQMNYALNEMRHARTDDDAVFRIGGKVFHIGDKVVQTDLSNGPVSNGDIGFVREISPEGGKRRQVFIEFPCGIVRYGFEEMKHVELGHALTVHKSQGCQYKCVILPLVLEHKRMLYNNLLLTAVSRATEQVHLVGEKEAFRLAVSQTQPVRGTLLGDMIKGHFSGPQSERMSADAKPNNAEPQWKQLSLADCV